MHRGSNCYLHSFRVAKLAIKRGARHSKIDLETLLVASILHDYYLYDWRRDRKYRKGHARNHPIIASEHAEKDFNISSEIKNIIKTHMWPFNIKMFPSSKEARVMSIADKSVALLEALTSKRHKAKKEKEMYNDISKLFNK